MGHNTHDDVARRWANRNLHPGKPALSSRNLHDRGDSIFSYGSHFEVGRILRDRKGNPTAWLLNGDRSTNTTTKHQHAVRSAVAATHLEAVTIPYSALAAAGISLASVQIIEVTPDTAHYETIVRHEMPGRWEYDYAEAAPGDYGGWQNSLTGEIVLRTKPWGERAPEPECGHEISVPGPWHTGWNYERLIATEEKTDTHLRVHHGIWEEFPAHRRQTGRKRVVSGRYIVWDVVDDGTGELTYQREIYRHVLGASLIRARVTYQARVRHDMCGGTGVHPGVWFTRAQGIVSGPLTKDQMDSVQERYEWRRDKRGADEPFGWAYELEGVVPHTECRGCGGTGWSTADRRRWAYFLSGFDNNETTPSYFFCELPPKARPTTVAEAYEALKPSAVKIAEQSGRAVNRQGDIFAIPMPGVTLRELKKQGGVHIRRPRLIEQDGRMVWSGPRPSLLGTNHVATEVVHLGALTYARGTLTHAPEGRRPDHRRVRIGDGKTWALVQKNTVPIAA